MEKTIVKQTDAKETAVNDVTTANGKVTLKDGVENFWAGDYSRGTLGVFNLNTFRKTLSDARARIYRLGEAKLICEITVGDAEIFMTETMFGGTLNGREMTPGGARAIHSTGVRLWNYFVDKGFAAENIFSEVGAEFKPSAVSGERQVLNKDQFEKAVHALLSKPSDYNEVKPGVFIYLICSAMCRTSDLLELTWDDVDEMLKNQNFDPIGEVLICNYRDAQAKVLDRLKMTNPDNLVFINENPAGGEAKVAYRSFAYNWFREKVLEPNKLPKVSVDSLRLMDPDVYGVLDTLEVGKDYPLLRPVTIGVIRTGSSCCFGAARTKEEKAVIDARREALRSRYVAEHGTVSKTISQKPAGTRKKTSARCVLAKAENDSSKISSR